MSRPWVPTLRALGGLQTCCPHSAPPPFSTSGVHQKTQGSQLCKRSSSWELRKGGGREGKKQKTAFQACFRLSEVEAGGEGRGWVWKEEWILFRHLALKVSRGCPRPSCLCLGTLPTSVPPLQLYSFQPLKGDDCSLRQDSCRCTPCPKNYLFWPLWILDSGIIPVGVVAAMTPSDSSLHSAWGKSQTCPSAAKEQKPFSQLVFGIARPTCPPKAKINPS